MPAPAVPTPTPGHLPGVDWLAYHDDLSGFSFQHPLTWQQRDTGGYPVVFALPAAPGTNLIEKTVEINVRQSPGDCRQSTYGALLGSENVRLNGTDYLRETGSGIAAGNIYDWTSYSTTHSGKCITVTFVLHSSSSGVYATEPAAFDRAAESEIFDELLNTFRFDP